MARSFGLFVKKRGHRRTGSPTVGSVGELIFFGVFLLVGMGSLAFALRQFVVPEWRVNHEFREAKAKVLAKRLVERQGDDGPEYLPQIQIEYSVGGTVYPTWAYSINPIYGSSRGEQQAILDQFAVGAEVPCWYDPLQPERVVLVRGYTWWMYLAIVAPCVFIIVGAAGLIYRYLHWGKSVERRAAMTQKRERLAAPAGRENGYSFLPVRDDITNSPGTRLRYRLPIGTSPGWMQFGILLACLVWNGIVAVMVAVAAGGWMAGDPQWFLTVFCIPFLAAGLFLVFLFFRQLLVTTGIGPTLLEISNHPLRPGETYTVFLSQAGRLNVQSLTLSLVCEEEATFRQGTNTRTEKQTVYKQEILRRESFEIPPGLPFEQEIDFVAPAGGMHSFRSKHNAIQWALLIEGDIAGWPDYKRAFPVLLYPPDGSRGT